MEFSNTYILLGDKFYQKVLPEHVAKPELLLWNESLASNLPVSESLLLSLDLRTEVFSGNQMLAGAQSIALAYSGHQFGQFNPQLGDGRAHLLGEVVTNEDKRVDIQLKGSGQTAFSRRGDGKCAIGPAVREYIMSEAMSALGVPTSRCLAVVTTGETLNRGLAKPGAVVTRVAASHIRVGTFQYFAARRDLPSLAQLTDYTIARHFPNIALDDPQKVIKLLEQVIDKQINLIVQWLRVGFIHGVMNTDNTAISGETIDFGPCAMMGIYHPDTVYSSIDVNGRYAFAQQRNIAQWNMARFADCLLMLFGDDQEAALEKIELIIIAFHDKFELAYDQMMANKIGLKDSDEKVKALVVGLTEIMQEQGLDYTQTFAGLIDVIKELHEQENKQKTATGGQINMDNKANVSKPFSTLLLEWKNNWLAYLEIQPIDLQQVQTTLQLANPIVIPRNHHIESVLAICEERGITEKVSEFISVIQSPYQTIAATKMYQDSPQDGDKNYQTFCGT